MNAVTSKIPSLALVGVPNCGKTALFNALTGSRQKVANYAGVTVERKQGLLQLGDGQRLFIIDLPGTYSLRARSPDEAVTRDVILGRLKDEVVPDLLVCVADATNLRLALRLVLELKLVGLPVILALNMIDIAERQGLRIDVEGLSRDLGLPVVCTSATRKKGLDDLTGQVRVMLEAAAPGPRGSEWHIPSTAEIRKAHADASRIMKTNVLPPLRPDTWTKRVDDVVLHPVGGIIILFAILFLMFQAVFSWATPAMDAIELTFAELAALVAAGFPPGLLQSFITDGLISGVGSVLVFLPQILILFFFIILLEDFGYMARAAFLMDKIMGGVGLHGRAFIPLLSSFACAIPGVMATRVIENQRDRLAVIMVAPLMTCSARIPVYTLIIAAFIPAQTVWGVFNLQGLVMFGLYVAGIGSALLISLGIRLLSRRSPDPFMMELPSYKMPSAENVLRNLWQRAKIFIRRAGVIIFPLMVLIWVLATFPQAPEGATDPAIDYSFAGMIGHAIAPLFAPIGFNWQMTVALIPGLAAREVAVAALGTVYAIGDAESTPGLLAATLAGQWSLATGLAFLAWYIFAPQCLATLGVVKRETNAWRWPVLMAIYMFVLAYLASFVTYRIAVTLGG